MEQDFNMLLTEVHQNLEDHISTSIGVLDNCVAKHVGKEED